MTPREALARLRDRLRRRQLSEELEAELHFHQQMLERDNRAAGAAPDAARRRSRLQLGNRTALVENTRDAWSLGWLDDMLRDARYALRTLRRSPVFVVVALLCLTLGIGANAAIFSVIDGVLLQPLPYPQAAQIVRLFESQPARGSDWTGSVSWLNFRDWREQSHAFSALAAYRAGSANLQGAGEVEHLRVVEATVDYFRVYGVAPVIGRGFARDEDESGRARVVVLSEGVWRSHFAGDRQISGRQITLDDQPYTVVGVMPSSFATSTDAWIPFVPQSEAPDSRGSHFLSVVGRLRPSVSVAQAGAQMRDIAARIAERFPNEQTGRSAAVESLSDLMVRGVRPALLVLLGAVGLVLLIACANVANLLLARAAAREQEISIRLALGAARARLIRQFLVESLLLSIAGTALGGLLARASIGPLVSLASSSFYFPNRIALNGTVLLFLAVIAVVSGIAFGFAPALRVTKGSSASLLSGAGKRSASGAQQRLRSVLVVAEIALSVILLVGSVLLIRSFSLLLGTSAGLDVEHVTTAHLSIPKRGYDATTLGPTLLQPILDRVRAIPGVASAGLISMLPIQDAYTNGSYYVPGDPVPEPGSEPIAEMRVVSPGTFGTLGVPLMAGRDFQVNDGLGQHVILINETLARNRFHGQSPIGQALQLGGPSGPSLTIIGVVGDVRQAGLAHAPLEEIDAPLLDTLFVGSGSMTDAVLVLKSDAPLDRLSSAIREAVRAVAPGQTIYRVMSMQQVLDESLATRRLNLVLLGVFAAVALALSAAGLYGVISYLVTQRTQEIGIRIALGARSRNVVSLVMKQGVAMTAVGLAIGLLGAVALSGALRSILYGVSPTDPLTYVVVAALLALVAAAATLLPARRAARVSPLVAMHAS